MIISAIVAVAENGVIGGDNQLLWHLPDDLKWFKAKTLNHCIFMGRKSYDAIGRPLPKRTNMVLTRNSDWQVEGVLRFGSLEEALNHASEQGEDEFFITGGGQVYADTLPKVQRLYLTQVHASYEGDTYFPEISMDEWKVVYSEDHAADEKHQHSFRFLILERI